MPFEEKCIKCIDENCLSCQMKNGKEQCIKCESGYEINEEKCQVCTLENCLKCYFNEGQEKCLQCEVGYETNKEGKCLNCSVLVNFIETGGGVSFIIPLYFSNVKS